MSLKGLKGWPCVMDKKVKHYWYLPFAHMLQLAPLYAKTMNTRLS